ncbi:MAG TPA: hypothetical protein GXX73_08250 [Clostridium sp.]|nr:hypothetical protein [Clostridium sp.]
MSKDCTHCGRPLNESQYRNNKQYKSCPNCSKKNGQEHVYYEYPSNFGTTLRRASANSPEGAQSYCVPCRSESGIASGGILCSEL